MKQLVLYKTFVYYLLESNKISNIINKYLKTFKHSAYLMEHLIDYWESERIVTNKKIIKAVKAIPRENFIENELLEEAYDDYPLPIPGGQTISQPTTVVIMLEALELEEGQKILEIGTGSGWNAALIAHIVGKKGMVYTTEIVDELIDFAKNNLKKIKLENIKVIHSDGSKGYEKASPYDRIIVTAACPKIPETLIKQLRQDGIIVAPVGSFFGQKMIKGRKKGKSLITEGLGYFNFVPLKGKYGY